MELHNSDSVKCWRVKNGVFTFVKFDFLMDRQTKASFEFIESIFPIIFRKQELFFSKHALNGKRQKILENVQFYNSFEVIPELAYSTEEWTNILGTLRSG